MYSAIQDYMARWPRTTAACQLTPSAPPAHCPNALSRCFPVLVAFGLALGAAAARDGAARSADWPQFLGPTRNGISRETDLLQTWPKEGPKILWEKPIGAGFSGPVVTGSRMILFHRVGDSELVECLDAASGKQLWKYAYTTGYQDDFGFDEGPRSTPLVAGDRVYTLGAEGVLHCLGLANGARIWSRTLNADYHVPKGFFGVATSPLLEGNHLLINIGGKKAGIVALAADTGKEFWKATDDEASYSSPVAATIDGVRHVFFFTRAGLISLDPENGTVRFRKPWRSRMNASVNAATPVVVADQVFLSACYDTGAIVLRVRKDGVDTVWASDEVLSNHYATSIYRDGFLYGFDGRQEQGARLRCVAFRTGAVRWTREKFGCGSMIEADGLLIILTEDGDLVQLAATPQGYQEKARTALCHGPCRAQIALANGRLYARDGKKLVCVQLGK